jgi:pimeloyl-ACP methyl ester carboxylesterase
MANRSNILEKRAFPRAPTYTQIKAHLRHRQEHLVADVGNISVAGMLVWVANPWEVGSILDFEFCVLDDRRPYIGRAEVMRVQRAARRAANAYGMGLRFLTVRPKRLKFNEAARLALYMPGLALSETVAALRYAWGELHGNEIEARELGKPAAGFREPILLVHGWLGTRGVLAFLERRLKRAGYPVFSIDLGPLNVGDIERSSELVVEKVNRLSERLGFRRITALAHSMGGLIALWGVKKLNLGDHVRRLITVGSPFRGTPWGYAGLTLVGPLRRSLLQMAPGSEFLRELNAAPPAENVEIVCFAARHDALVAPQSATLDGARNILIDGGHASLITSPPAIDRIMAVLENRDPFAS